MENRDFKPKPPLQTTPSWNHFHLENSQLLLQTTGRLVSWIIKVFFKAFYTYLHVRVRAPSVHSGTCVHRCTPISLSSINILYVRAVNTPWSCVYVFFKVSYPQCYVNNSIYWLMKLCVDLYPPDIVYVALSSQIKYKTTTSRSSSPLCSVLNIQL